jgi:hypothetical protein
VVEHVVTTENLFLVMTNICCPQPPHPVAHLASIPVLPPMSAYVLPVILYLTPPVLHHVEHLLPSLIAHYDVLGVGGHVATLVGDLQVPQAPASEQQSVRSECLTLKQRVTKEGIAWLSVH